MTASILRDCNACDGRCQEKKCDERVFHVNAPAGVHGVSAVSKRSPLPASLVIDSLRTRRIRDLSRDALESHLRVRPERFS